MSQLNLAVIAGDGTGPEVVDQALRILDAITPRFGLSIDTTALPYGGKHYLDTGSVITDEQVAELKQYDSIFLGAVGHPDVAPGILERGLLLKLRFDLDQYINLRPVRLYPGVASPLANITNEQIDMVVVRENTEDLYCGSGGIARKNTPQEIATQEMLATRFGVERCLRYAFNVAQSRPRKHLTLVHKTNVLTFAGDLWMRAFTEIGQAEFPEVERAYHHVDACCMYLATSPERYDTVVTANMFGDIITDLGAAIAGGMGIASSGNLNPSFDSSDPTTGGPSMFEPVHGSSPDIAGQNKANPLAAIDSLGLLLTETGRFKAEESLTKAGEALNQAVIATTPEFAGKRLDRSGYSTSEIGDMVLKSLGLA